MNKYLVTFYYHTNCQVEVEASNEKDAKEKAYSLLGDDDINNQILEGLQEDSSPDCEQLCE